MHNSVYNHLIINYTLLYFIVLYHTCTYTHTQYVYTGTIYIIIGDTLQTKTPTKMSRNLEKSIRPYDKSYSLGEQKYLKIIQRGSEAGDNCDLLFKVKYRYSVIKKIKSIAVC